MRPHLRSLLVRYVGHSLGNEKSIQKKRLLALKLNAALRRLEPISSPRVVMELVFCPFMDRARFAQMVGVTPDVVERWIRDGRVKTYQMGKRSLIDMRQWLTAGDAQRSTPSGRGGA